MKIVVFLIVLFICVSPLIVGYGLYLMLKERISTKTEEEIEKEGKERDIRMSSELWKVVMILAAFGCIALWDY